MSEGFIKFPRAYSSLMPQLKEAELKILLAVCDSTISWGYRQAQFSYKELEEATGLSRRSIVSGLASLRESELISTTTIRQKVQVQILHSTGAKLSPHEVQINHPSKLTLKNKKNYKKNIASAINFENYQPGGKYYFLVENREKKAE